MLDSFWGTLGPYRLIIVDNGSTDGTKEFLEKLPEDNAAVIHLHFNSENKGIAMGRNQGLLLADKFGADDEYLATIDNDIELYPNWLTDCTDVIQANPRMAIGLNFEGTEYPLVMKNNKTLQIKSAGNLGTACSVFHRELHKKIGFFNTEYGLYGEEDADFYFRARMMGWECGYLPNKGIHFGEGALDEGKYRDFKTQQHKDNLAKFQRNCYAYMNRMKPVFMPYHGPSM